MNINLTKTIILALGVASASALSGCIEETFPTSLATADQVAKDPSALSAIVNSLSNYTMSVKTYGSTDYTDGGLPGQMFARDVLCEDFPVYDTTMDWYNSLATCFGSYWGAYPYYYFYTFIDKSNDVLKSVNLDELEGERAHMIGNILGYRAMCYLDMARMYEYKLTGYPQLDNRAIADNILGLTVPIMEARDYTVQEMIKNPRAPFHTMYRFIMTDLNNAERLLDGYNRPQISYMNQSVIHGFKARLWLEMATRFDRNPEDLALQLADEGAADGYDDLSITSAMDCYKNALAYAEKVIGAGFTPLTSAEWHDPVTGFNTPTSSWVWGSYVTTYDQISGSRWYSMLGWINTDSNWSWCSQYSAYRCISSKLYASIPDSDWRKNSWIAPEDAGDPAAASKYSTNSANFDEFPAYANLKFHVPDLDSYMKGLVASIPFMRVEEMHLLRAEALYHTEGLGSAKTALESFVNTYRYTDNSYQSSASDYDSFIADLMNQRRIEFWGEGHVYFDYKRLALSVNRAYDGTNFPETARLVTNKNFVAPWMNCYISEYAISMKDASFKGNPDFDGIVSADTN